MSPHSDRSLETWTLMFWCRCQRLVQLREMDAPEVLISREESLVQKARDGMRRARDR